MTELEQNIIDLDNIVEAYHEVTRGKKEKLEWQLFEMHKEEVCIEIQNELVWRTYEPGGVVTFPINEPKLRIIKRPLLKDRIVHHALIRQIEPFFEKIFSDSCYACRSGKEHITVTYTLSDGKKRVETYYPKLKGAMTYDKRMPYYLAVKAVREQFSAMVPEAKILAIELHEGRGQLSAARHYQSLIRKGLGRYGGDLYVLSIDFKSFFQSIDHEVLKALVAQVFQEEPFAVWLMCKIVDAIDEGLPIGFLPSQHLANLMGSIIDRYLESCDVYFVRYMDDIKVLAGSREEARQILQGLDEIASKILHLTLSEKKTFIRHFESYDTFVGFKVYPHHLEIKPSSLARSERRARKKREDFKQGRITAEAYCSSVENIIAQLSATTTPAPRWILEIVREARDAREQEKENEKLRISLAH